MASNAAVIDDLERIGAIEEARVNDSGTPGEYFAKVIGGQFQADWFELCQWDYLIRTVDREDIPGLHLTLDRRVDGSAFVFPE